VTPSHHPSHPRSGSHWMRPKPGSDIELRRRSAPITCGTCRVTYLTPVPLPASVKAEPWVCSVCLHALFGLGSTEDASELG
jgi:hypothetical protein